MRKFAAALASSALLVFSFGHVCAWQTIPDPVVSDPQPAATTAPQSLNDYINNSGEPLAVAQLGIQVSDDSAKLDDSGAVSGAGVIEVSGNGASAGILDDHHTSHMMVTGALVGAGLAAAVLFPPAVIPILLVAHVRSSGEAADVIIAVDGNRVRNTLDLMEAVQDIRTGDAVYLTIVRNGQRKQVVVHVR